MPEYIKNPEWLVTIWPLVVISLLISGAILVALRLAIGQSELLKPFLIVFSFSILGAVVGWMTGDSGDPVLSAVLPAVLSLVGGMGVYLIGHEERDSAIVAAGISALAINLLVATLISAQNAREYDVAIAALERERAAAVEAQQTRSLERALAITPANKQARIADWSALLDEQEAARKPALVE